MINEFPESIQKSLTEMQIKSLTPIQKEAIPKILEGKNLIALSETGSGKTLAFVLPLILKLIGQSKKPTRALVITPTKELAEQILSVLKHIARYTNLISMSLYGGKSQDEQTRALKNGVHLLVACPGRLKDHIDKKTIDLSGIETLVLDEADQLMDMGFYPHLKVALEASQNRKQTLLFSATMCDDVKNLTDEFLKDAEFIFHKANKPKASIEEIFAPITIDLRYPFLRFLLKHHKIKSGLIFTKTKEEARLLGAALVEDKYKACVLEGDMTTHQRKKALNSFRDKSISLLVATDLASRGLDIPHVTHVINFNPPLESDSYVHRLGRTARHDKGGLAITIYLKEEQIDLEEILSKRKLTLSPKIYKEFNYALKLDKKSIRLI